MSKLTSTHLTFSDFATMISTIVAAWNDATMKLYQQCKTSIQSEGRRREVSSDSALGDCEGLWSWFLGKTALGFYCGAGTSIGQGWIVRVKKAKLKVPRVALLGGSVGLQGATNS